MCGAAWWYGRRKRGECRRQVRRCGDDLVLAVPWHFLSLSSHCLVYRLHRVLNRETLCGLHEITLYESTLLNVLFTQK